MALEDPIRTYYDVSGEREWERLVQPDDGAIERALHERALRTYLPPIVDPTDPPWVLDVGGGPGRWTFWLVEHGYAASLVELSPKLVALARRRMAEFPFAVQNRIERLSTGDARDLSRFPDACFDAALSLGPFYHLQSAEDRDRAASELRRVLKPGGVCFAAVMPRHLRLLAAALDPGETRPLPELAAEILDHGRFDDPRPGRFTGAHLVDPADVAPFFARHGFETLRLMASQGPLATLQADVAALAERDPARHRDLLEYAWRVAGDPSILGLAGHLLYIGTAVTG